MSTKNHDSPAQHATHRGASPPAPAASASPAPLAGPPVINPNLPNPVVLSSNLAPPPVHPVPVANWVVLPVVPQGFPAGPFGS